jgi:hypothetical protein
VITVQRLTTNLIFIVGRNMSMGTKIGETTRINAVQSALRNLIQPFQNKVNFGYAEFPGTGPGSCSNTCCGPTNTVTTQPNSLIAIGQAMDRCDFSQSCLAPNDARPIAQALMAVPTLRGSNSPFSTVVLLVDGPPGCPSEDPNQTCQPALDAVSMLKNFSSDLYVVALGQDAQNNKCLRNMAARGTVFPGEPIGIWEGSQDPIAMLTTAIQPILDGAAETSCTIDLRSKPAHLDQVSLWVSGAEVPFDPSGRNGWRFQGDSSRRIEVSGRSCEDLRRARPADVYALFGCAPCGETYPCPPRM